MKGFPIRVSWLDRVIEVNKFHILQCKENPNWRLVDTAEFLSCSIGSVSQDLLLASWLRSTHQNKIRSFKRKKDALQFVRLKKHEFKLLDIE